MTAAAVDAADPAAVCDVARFERVYVACHQTVLNTLRRGLANGWQAVVGGFDESGGGVSPEELAQEAWLHVWRKWPTLATAHDDRLLYAYALTTALTTARHVLIDRQRYRQMRRRVGERTLSDEGWEAARDQLADLAREGQPEETTLDAESWREALALVRSLPHTPRTHGQLAALLVAMLVAMTTDEPQEATAERLGVPVSTIKMRKLRLRQTLRAWRNATTAALDLEIETTDEQSQSQTEGQA